ncbi:MAG: substrate-binding domain-containing protein [Planctomycetes bacterium]|nr:substrate-binding domain-containing protein [Planctomycetota bacterium]
MVEMMEFFAVIGITWVGVWLMRRACQNPYPADTPLPAKLLGTVWKLFLLVLGVLLAGWILGESIGAGYGIALWGAGFFLVWLVILENVFHWHHPSFSMVRWLVYPAVLVAVWTYDAQRRFDPSLLVVDGECHQTARSSRSEAKEAPVFLEEPTFAGVAVPRIHGVAFHSEGAESIATVLHRDPAPVGRMGTRIILACLIFSPAALDLVLAFHPSAEVMAMAAEAGLSLKLTPVARTALLFMAHADNPVQSLTAEQVRGIYDGAISNWQQVGGLDETILAFQRPPYTASQGVMREFMREKELMPPPSETLRWGVPGVRSRVARYHNYRSALGYCLLNYSEAMAHDKTIRFLAIDGVYPERETIGDGSYPVSQTVYAVTTDHSRSGTAEVVDWLLSPQGQRLLAANGFAPVADTAD